MSNLVLVSGKSERRAARSVVADYHDAQLGELVDRVGEAIDRYRAGELDAFEIDRVLFQYSRAAKELWKFCNYLQVEVAAAMIREQPPNDWWERGAPRERLTTGGTAGVKTHASGDCAPRAGTPAASRVEGREQGDRTASEVADDASHVGVGDVLAGCDRTEIDGAVRFGPVEPA